MTDKTITYAGALVEETDLAYAQRGIETTLGPLVEAIFGTRAVVSGLTPTATSPVSMQLQLARGCMMQLSTVDATAFGSLPSDSRPLVKIAVNLDPTMLTFTAPTGTGMAQNFLVEASFSETDADPVVLPYFNASNLSVGYNGPGNSGTPQATHRIQRVVLQVVPGTAAATGTQATPGVTSSAWVPLHVVTVVTGQTLITTGSVVQHPGAPYVVPLPSRVERGTGVGQSNNLVKIGWDGVDLLCTIDVSAVGAFAFKAWVAANFVPRALPHHFTTSNTWVCPAGVTLVQFDVVGPGGAGGAGNTGYSGGGGGGGGRVTGFAVVVPGTSYTLTIPTGGTTQPAGTTGGSGGTTVFDAFATATGGSGGGSNSPYCAGGAGGGGAIGTGVSAIASAGGYGSDGQSSASATGGVTIFGGNGGNGARGDGGGRAGSGGGLSPVGPGGGGGGGYNGAAPGAAGGSGEIVLWY